MIRVVYDGPPTSGKTTSLRSLATRLGQRDVYTPEEAAGRTVFFDWMEFTGGRFEGRQIRCQIVSVPGQRELLPRRQLLLASADAVIFVADTTRAGVNESVAHLDDLMSRVKDVGGLPVGVVVQANKRDRPDAAPLEMLRGRPGVAVVESIASAGEGIREAFVFAVRLALDRVREQMSRGELVASAATTDAPEELLKAMRALPFDARAHALWPERAPTSTRQEGETPRVPDASIPGGWIWPPIQGRVLLQEATAGALSSIRELSPGEWLAESAAGWRFHTSAAHRFTEADAARSALIRWAQVHASVAGWTSPHRCIALCEDPGGLRLWQIVRNETSLWKRASEAVASGTGINELSTFCSRAGQRWAQAPVELPCTLETVGVVDGLPAFISLMPNSDQTRPPDRADRTSRLWHQLEMLVKSERRAPAHTHLTPPTDSSASAGL
ncbi:MAG: GTPase domain-containing protein [Archangium sp.]|nr:GTPase domain-containing protein [Archangium sp.]